MLRVLFFDVEEGLLVLGVGEAPRDVLVVSDQHDRRARDADAGRVVARGVDRVLEPDRGQRQVKVRITREQGASAHALAAGDRPVVARAPVGDESGRQGRQALVQSFRGRDVGRRHRRDLLRRGRFRIRARVVRRLGCRWENREPLRRQVRPQGLVEQPHDKRVVGEVQGLRHVALDEQRVDGRPRLRLVAEQREHRVELMALLCLVDAVIHPLRVGLQRVAGWIRGRQLRPLELGGAKQPELQLEPVGVDSNLADDVGQPSGALAAHEVHLEKAELRVHVSEGEEEVVVCLRGDVRGAVWLEDHADRLLETGQAERAVGDLGVGGHCPRPRGRVEGRAEGRQARDRKEGDVQHRGRDHDRRPQVDEGQARASKLGNERSANHRAFGDGGLCGHRVSLRHCAA